MIVLYCITVEINKQNKTYFKLRTIKGTNYRKAAFSTLRNDWGKPLAQNGCGQATPATKHFYIALRSLTNVGPNC